MVYARVASADQKDDPGRQVAHAATRPTCRPDEVIKEIGPGCPEGGLSGDPFGVPWWVRDGAVLHCRGGGAAKIASPGMADGGVSPTSTIFTTVAVHR